METNLKHITGHIRKVADNVEETRTIEFVISTAKKDRHGTIIPIENWDLDNFNRNGIVGYQHDVYGSWFGENNPDKVIGVGKAWIEDDQLIGSVQFEPAELNPLAEKIFRKILIGSLKSTSVGFIETSAGECRADNPDDPKSPRTYYYGKVELLEFSIVNIPSNSDAVKRQMADEQKAVLKEAIREVLAEREQNEEGQDPQPEGNPQPAEADLMAQRMRIIYLQELELNQ